MLTAKRLPSSKRLERLVSLRLWALADVLEARLEEELLPLGISVAAFRLVGELMRSRKGLRQGELARRLRVKPPSVTAMVTRLEADGIVVTEADPLDARVTVIRLAENAPLTPGLAVLERIDRALLGETNPDYRDELVHTLDQLLLRLAPAERK